MKKGKKTGGTLHYTYVSDELDDEEQVDPLMEGYNSMVGYHTLKRLEAHRADTAEYNNADDSSSDLEQNVFGNVARRMEEHDDPGWMEAYNAGVRQGRRSSRGDSTARYGGRKRGPFNLDSDSDNE